MAEMNEIFTRLQLKHDTYANWMAVQDTFKPLAGEICVVEIPSANSATTTTPPTVLFKVGMYKKDASGNDTTELYTFKELNWGSALAADVYAWAKEQSMFSSVVATTTTTGEGDKQKTYVGNAVTNVEWDSTLNEGKGGIKFTKGTQFATKAELDAALEAFGGDLDAITDTDTRYSFEIPTTGDHKGKLAITAVKYTNGTAEGAGTTTYYDFVTPDELEKILEGYVVEVKGSDCIEVDDTDPQRPIVKHKVPTGATEGEHGSVSGGGLITHVTTDEFGHITGVKDETLYTYGYGDTALGQDPVYTQLNTASARATGARIYYAATGGINVKAEIGDDNAKLTIDGSDLLQDAKDYTDEEIAKAHANVVDYRGVANALTDLAQDAGRGDFYRVGTEIKSGDTVLAYAGDLIVAEKDKPAQQIDGTNWTAIHCGDGDISEVVAGDGLTGGGATGSVTVGLSDATKASLGNADTAYGWGDHAQEGYLKAGDIANKADKVTGATAGNFAGLDANGNLTDSGSKAADFATAAQGAKADDSINAVYCNEDQAYDDSIQGALNISVNGHLGADGRAIGIDIAVKKGGIIAEALADDVKELIKTEAATLDAVVLAESQKYTDEAIDDLHAIATSGSIYDVAEGHKVSTGADDTGAKYIVFNCGSSTTVI